MQASVQAVSAAQESYLQLQVAIVPLLLINWMAHANRSLPFRSIMMPLVLLAVPLLELAAIISSVALLLGFCFTLLIGERVERWSSITNAMQRMYEHVLVGVLLGA